MLSGEAGIKSFVVAFFDEIYPGLDEFKVFISLVLCCYSNVTDILY